MYEEKIKEKKSFLAGKELEEFVSTNEESFESVSEDKEIEEDVPEKPEDKTN